MQEPNTNQPLRVRAIRIKSFVGIDDIEIHPGHLTIVQGYNGEGKTSITSALESIFEGGDASKLIRNGEDRAEIGLLLSNGITFTKAITRGGRSTLKEMHPEYGSINAAQTHLSKLSDQFSVSPAILIDCKPEDRVKAFLGALPLELDREALTAILPKDVEIPEGHPLKVIPAVRKVVADRRKHKHVQKDEKLASVTELNKSLPPSDQEEKDITQRLAATKDQLTGRRSALSNAEEYIRQNVASNLKQIEKEKTEFLAKWQEDLDAKMEQVRIEFAKAKDEMLTKLDNEIKQWIVDRNEMLDTERTKYQAEIESLTADVSRLEQLSLAEAGHENTRQIIRNATEQAKRLQAEWQQLDRMVKDLDIYESSLTSNLPIEGLEVKEEEIYYAGIPWYSLNTAKKIEIIFKLAELRAKDLPFIFFDGLESLDTKNFEIFKEYALQSDKQILVTRVADSPLEIKTYEREPVEEGMLL